MQTTASIVLGAVMATIGARASGGEFYECGEPCLNSLVGSADSYGCGTIDTACLCKKDEAVLAFRKCAWETCTDAHQAEEVAEYAIYMCDEAGVTVTMDPVEPGYTAEEEEEDATTCGEKCLYQIMEEGKEAGCDSEDVECLCKSDAIAVSLRTCAYEMCPLKEAGELIEYGLDVCEGVGVTITVPTGVPTSVPTASGSSSDASTTASSGSSDESTTTGSSDAAETSIIETSAATVNFVNAVTYALAGAAGFAVLLI